MRHPCGGCWTRTISVSLVWTSCVNSTTPMLAYHLHGMVRYLLTIAGILARGNIQIGGIDFSILASELHATPPRFCRKSLLGRWSNLQMVSPLKYILLPRTVHLQVHVRISVCWSIRVMIAFQYSPVTPLCKVLGGCSWAEALRCHSCGLQLLCQIVHTWTHAQFQRTSWQNVSTHFISCIRSWYES